MTDNPDDELENIIDEHAHDAEKTPMTHVYGATGITAFNELADESVVRVALMNEQFEFDADDESFADVESYEVSDPGYGAGGSAVPNSRVKTTELEYGREYALYGDAVSWPDIESLRVGGFVVYEARTPSPLGKLTGGIIGVSDESPLLSAGVLDPPAECYGGSLFEIEWEEKPIMTIRPTTE